MQAIFASDSTFQLVKKLFIYRMMSSNFFINNALCGMRLAYKFMGRSLTNLLINSTAGSVRAEIIVCCALILFALTKKHLYLHIIVLRVKTQEASKARRRMAWERYQQGEKFDMH
jgi:hypothetical protein